MISSIYLNSIETRCHYCFYCDKKTETTNERKEELNECYILIGICKVCNKSKTIKKLKKNIKCDLKLLV